MAGKRQAAPHPAEGGKYRIGLAVWLAHPIGWLYGNTPRQGQRKLLRHAPVTAASVRRDVCLSKNNTGICLITQGTQHIQWIAPPQRQSTPPLAQVRIEGAQA